MEGFVEVAGYQLALDRGYEPVTHLWVQVAAKSHRHSVRVGMDPLSVETSGTVAQLAFLPAGDAVLRGESFGSLEAAKFVGPLESPLTGTVVAVNEAVLADPSLVERDPFGAGWLVEIELADPDELGLLVVGEERIAAWFAAAVEDYKLKGLVAE